MKEIIIDEWEAFCETSRWHELANRFPLSSAARLNSLVADITERGLKVPVVLHEGKVLDGRNRLLACKTIGNGIQPDFVEWQPETGETPEEWVLRVNAQHRDLSSSQRAAAAVAWMPYFEDRAKKRQGARTDLDISPKLDGSGDFQRAADEAAAYFATNKTYVYDALSLHEQALDLFEQVRIGEMSIAQAKREHTKRTKVIPPPIEGKHRVWYADPPWNYGNSGLDDYGHAERHYPTMDTEDLCELGDELVKPALEDDAVLFLWVTSPLLEDGLKVIRAWGFEYKTSFIWDKVSHNFGYYNSVRHEFLLVATRGSCTPEVSKLFDSVVEIERTSKHSEKPDAFVEMIETLYPSGNRVELFGRKEREGWTIWGNENLTMSMTDTTREC